jgi:DivIVA domain-containing protein
MDVTPQLIEQIDFSEKFRGYDQDQVDDFLERVGATIAELNKSLREANDRLEEAEQEVERLRSFPADAPAPAVAASAVSDEEEMAQAARTLMLARRTADAAIGDARQEAQQMLTEAQARLDQANRDADAAAENVLVAARAEAADLVHQATLQAEREGTARKEEVKREVIELDLRRTLLASDVAALEGRIDRYRDKLSQVHGSISSILDDPSSLRNEPPHEFVADRPVVEAVGYDTAPPLDDPSAERTVDGPGAAATGETTEADVVAGDEHEGDPAGEPTASAGPTTDEVQVSFDAGRTDSGRVDAVAPFESDPWGPGSWSEVALAGAVQAAAAPDAPSESRQGSLDDPVFTGPSTGSYGGLSQDRYLRDLDEAVNQPVADDDDAMSAFFEGDDDEAQARRFGRRR